MKKIDCTYSIPEPINFTMEDFITYLIDSHESFISDAKGVRAAVRIENAIKDKKNQEEKSDGNYLLLDDEDVNMLHNSAENPGRAGYPTAVGKTADGDTVRVSLSRKCLPFIDAIKKSKETT